MNTPLGQNSCRTSYHGIHRISSLPVLVLLPHNRCNCRCLMCDIWKIRQVREITASDLQPHLESLRALHVRWVVFSGGEPLMHSDLAQLAAAFRKEGMRLTLLTAGLPLARHASMVVDHFDDVIVSLDGPPAIHNQIRNVPRAFERLAEGVRSLRRIRSEFAVHARTTIQRGNCTHLRETVRTAKGMKLNSISFLAVDVTSHAFNRPEGWTPDRQNTIGLGPAEVEALGSEIEALNRENANDIDSGFIRENAGKLRGIVQHFRAHLGQVPPTAPRCNAPWVSAVIEADGTVRPCFFQPSIGNLQDGPLTEVLNGQEAMRFRAELDVPTNPICQRCVCSLYVPESGMPRWQANPSLWLTP
ncbi:MAG: radical SAM protein [Terriglobia bacterium]